MPTGKGSRIKDGEKVKSARKLKPAGASAFDQIQEFSSS
ncbi:hypothetical protein Z949_1143 [Sulfitobacter guttiformis KCTC 32187]|nr:hypothetical protein Z949_1143 [Sulfitobacter guttiformis KCTC 32187]